MTFTIIAHDDRTGDFGVCMATNSPAVGNRCQFVRNGVGALAFQSIAEPRLTVLAARLLEFGWSAQKVIDELLSTDRFRELRQIGVIDRDGQAAVFTGAENGHWAGHIVRPGHIALGNALAGEATVRAIAWAYEQHPDHPFEDRLLRAIEAGRDAGGQLSGQTSAALLTYGRAEFARCDLRVDVNEEPVAELRRIYDWFAPLIPFYLERPRNPNIGSYRDWFTQHGHERTFGRRPPVTLEVPEHAPRADPR